MPGQSISHVLRQLARANATATRALSAPTGQQFALQAIAPELLAQVDAMEAAHATVRAAEKSTQKEVREALATLKPLASAYDQAREALAVKLPTSYPAASSFGTPDDLLHTAEELERELDDNKQQTWAAAILATFQPILDAAIKEQADSSDAYKALQKAQAAREQAAGTARPILVRFRRAVRATFGRTSREYHELADRRGTEDAEDEAPTTPTGTAAPAPTPTP